jgi:hypothetical protein
MAIPRPHQHHWQPAGIQRGYPEWVYALCPCGEARKFVVGERAPEVISQTSAEFRAAAERLARLAPGIVTIEAAPAPMA